MTLKVKISRNGHFIDDSNKYRFIYVPRNISTEKKKNFHERFGFNFFPEKIISAGYARHRSMVSKLKVTIDQS